MLEDRIITPEQAAKAQTDSLSAGDLLIWTVCRDPTDYPGKFTARPHSGRRNTPLTVVLIADTLEAIRESLPAALTHFPRDPSDDAKIVECWL